MEELLEFFRKQGVSLQITLDIDLKATVHAIPSSGGYASPQVTSGDTPIEALQNMKERLYSDELIKVKDRVEILDTDGNGLANGTVVNINEFRELSMMYAVDVDGYSADVLFFGEGELRKL